jgi:hypothetical protein
MSTLLPTGDSSPSARLLRRRRRRAVHALRFDRGCDQATAENSVGVLAHLGSTIDTEHTYAKNGTPGVA